MAIVYQRKHLTTVLFFILDVLTVTMLRYAFMDKSTPKTPLYFSENFMRSIHRTVFILDKLAARILETREGITFSQFMVMIGIACTSRVSQKNIAEFLNITEAAVSRQIDKLEKKGFLSRHTNPNSRREHILALTDRGKKEFEETRAMLLRELDDFFKIIKEKDRETIIRIFDSLLQEAKDCEHVHTLK